MPEPPTQQPLDYSKPGLAARSPSGGMLVAATLCIVLGVLLAGIGLAAFATSLMEGWIEGPALVFALVGGAFCAVGMRLKRRKPPG